MSIQYLIVLLLLVFLAVLVGMPSTRAFFMRGWGRLRGHPAARSAAPANTGVTIIAGNGEEFPLPDNDRRPAPGWRARMEGMGGPRRALAIALIGLLLLIAAFQLFRLTTTPAVDQFVVLVAPFHEPDGTISQTGREVASQLVAALPEDSGGRVVARAIPEPPADAEAALALMGREGADALVAGQINAGGMLDQESLQPTLIYQPNGPFAPAGWDQYAGRFVMPTSYTLATAPINGRVVLSSLLGALADYDDGHVDSAFTTLGMLADTYQALTPELPRALRGNLLWARGEYAQAAGEYNRAINGSARASTDPQRGLLLNNLGAILQDAGDPAVTTAFSQSVEALGGQDLSALRYNLGIEALRAGRYTDAVTSLEIARSPNLLPPGTPTTPLLLRLSQAYRLSGALDQARAMLDAATLQITSDAMAATPEQRSMADTRLRTAATEERALLGLAQAIGAQGPLLWEMSRSEPLPAQPLNVARADMTQAADDTALLVQRWSRQSAAKDAAAESIAGRIAIGQAQRALAHLRERQRWQAAIETELGRAQGALKPRGLAAIWAALVGDRSPMGHAREQLTTLLESQPNDVDALVLLGRNQLFSGDPAEAGKQFDQAAAAAPTRAEPVYGQALVALPTDRQRGRQLLAQAIALDGRFFPAREKLAAIAQEDQDWQTAIVQRRWLAQQRPSTANTLALAETLRLSGPGGYSEAERQLLPLANQNNSAALLALSRLYNDLHNTDAARDVLERAQRAAPRDPEVAYTLGKLFEEQGDTNSAEAQYQRAIEADPNNIRARIALGGIYVNSSRPDQADRQYRAALDAGANDPDTLKQIGAALMEHGQYQSASEAYSRAVKVRPDDPELHHGLGQASLQLKRLDTAQSEEQQALNLRSGRYPEALVGLGDVALQRGRTQEAVQQYNAALAQNDRLTAAYLGLGRAAAAEGNWSVAQAHFGNAVSRDGRSAEAHLWLAEALIRQDNASGAIDEYTRALDLKQDYPEAYFGRAQAQLSVGQLDEAQSDLDRAFRYRASYPEAFLLQGKLYEQRGAEDQAIAAYGKAIDASSALGEARYRRALLYIRNDQIDNATGDLESAIRIQPNFPEAHYWLGRAYLAQGRAKLARDQFQQAVEQRGGNYAEARFYQGIAEEQLGQRTEAVASYQAALDQDNGSVWAGQARTALTRLKQP